MGHKYGIMQPLTSLGTNFSVKNLSWLVKLVVSAAEPWC